MKSTLITTSVASGLYVGYKAITTDGELDSEKSKKALTTSLIATGTSAVSNTIVEIRSDRILDRYAESHASAYVESMSDDELVEALKQLDLLEQELPEENNIKSL